jgi:hypothetical protein
MNIIRLKGYYLNKCTYWLIAISITIWIIVFATINISREDRWCLSTMLTGLALMIVFYLNRLDAKSVILKEGNFEINYFDQGRFFTKKDISFNKNDITVLDKSDKLTLSTNSGIVARLRKKAADAEDWITLENYFKD